MKNIYRKQIFAMTLGFVAATSLVAAFGQASTAHPSVESDNSSTFQVATIKPSTPDEVRTIQIRGGHQFATTATTLIDVIKYCYGVHAEQVVDGPQWMRTTKFDILAEANPGAKPTSDEMKKMVRDLLADRFHFTFRKDKRNLAVYAIVIAKGGPKLTKSTRDPNGIPVVSYTPGGLAVGNATLADLATFLQRYVTDRPVINQTDVKGKYDLNLHWTPDDSPQSTDQAHEWPSLYTAIQEQLGLKLKPTKASAEVLAVEHVEMPSEN